MEFAHAFIYGVIQHTLTVAFWVPGPVLSPAGWEAPLSGQGDWLGTQKTAAEDTHTQRWGLQGKV